MMMRFLLLAGAAALMHACAVAPPADQLAPVMAQPFPELGAQVELLSEAPESRAQMLQDGHLLHQPLDPSGAQRIALLNSPVVARYLAEMGIARGSALQVALPENPGFSLSALQPESGGRWKLDVGFTLGILDWFTRPLRQRLSEDAVLEAQLVLAEALTNELNAVVKEYFRALAQRHRLQILRSNLEAAQTADALAAALFEAGNISELARMQHTVDAQRRQADVWDAEQAVRESEVALKERLGLRAEESLILPDSLPAADSSPLRPEHSATELLEASAENHPLLLLAERQVAWSKSNLSLVRRYGAWVQLEPGVAFEREGDGSTLRGVSVEAGLPFFDQGQAREMIAEAQVEAALAAQSSHAIALQARIARALAAQRAASQKLQLLQAQVIPQQERMLVLALEQYNFMLSDAFSLLQIKQSELDSRLDAVNALEAHWLSLAELAAASAQPFDLNDLRADEETSLSEGATAPSLDAADGHQHEVHQHD